MRCLYKSLAIRIFAQGFQDMTNLLFHVVFCSILIRDLDSARMMTKASQDQKKLTLSLGGGQTSSWASKPFQKPVRRKAKNISVEKCHVVGEKKNAHDDQQNTAHHMNRLNVTAEALRKLKKGIDGQGAQKER